MELGFDVLDVRLEVADILSVNVRHSDMLENT
jgi:hypothetical protein